MRRQRQRLERRRKLSVHPPEGLPPGFPLEKVLTSLLVQHALIQLEVLREGLPQPRPQSAPPAE